MVRMTVIIFYWMINQHIYVLKTSFKFHFQIYKKWIFREKSVLLSSQSITLKIQNSIKTKRLKTCCFYIQENTIFPVHNCYIAFIAWGKVGGHGMEGVGAGAARRITSMEAPVAGWWVSCKCLSSHWSPSCFNGCSLLRAVCSGLMVKFLQQVSTTPVFRLFLYSIKFCLGCNL